MIVLVEEIKRSKYYVKLFDGIQEGWYDLRALIDEYKVERLREFSYLRRADGSIVVFKFMENGAYAVVGSWYVGDTVFEVFDEEVKNNV